MGVEEHQRAVAAEKQADILMAARLLFGELGYERVSVGRVAKAANVSTATLYKHFRSKEELFGAIVAERCQQFEMALSGLDLDDDLGRGVAQFAEAYGDLLARDETVETLRLLIGDAPRFPHLAARFFERIVGPLRAPLIRYLRGQVRAGHAVIEDEDLAVRQLLGMIEGCILWPKWLSPDGLPDTHARTVVDGAVETWLARYAVSR